MLIQLQSGLPLLFQKFRTVIFAYLMTDISCLHKVKIRLSKFLKFLKADQMACNILGINFCCFFNRIFLLGDNTLVTKYMKK